MKERRGWEAVQVYCPCGYLLPHPSLPSVQYADGWCTVECVGCREEVVGQFWRHQTGIRLTRLMGDYEPDRAD